MIARIFIEPHERVEGLEAYRDWLTPEQIDTIMDAPEGSMFALKMTSLEGIRTCDLTVIEEG